MNNEIKFLPPFKRMCMSIGTLPSSFYASMSYYESMVWLYEYLKNEVIPVVNNNSEVAKELQDAFITLENYIENYFDNLDIQEEINVKLDEMAEDGTLADMVAEYIRMQGQLVYDSVASMKLAENIQNGSFLKTYGFYAYNDGGGALYKARTVTNEDVIDEMTIIALHDNTLVAELIIMDSMTPEMFGAHGDGTTDDAIPLQKLLDTNTKAILKNIYLTSTTINVKNDIEMLGKSYIKAKNTLSTICVEIAHGTQQIEKNYKINVDANGTSAVGIAIGSPRKCNLTLNVINAGETGINCNYYSSTGNNENTIRCNVIGNSSGTTVRGVLCNCFDNIFESIVTQDCQRGVEVNNGELIANEVHSWLSNDLAATLWSTSCVVYNAGYFLQIIDWLYQDSVKYGITGSAAYGSVKYFEYNNTLTNASTLYNDYLNVYNTSGPIRLTIDYFKNVKTETQRLKYDKGTSSNSEFGILIKNGVTSNPNEIQNAPPFTDCDNAPEWGGYLINWDTTNNPTSVNGYLKCEVIGSSVRQQFFPNQSNFSDVPRSFTRIRQLGSTTWSSWVKTTYTT